MEMAVAEGLRDRPDRRVVVRSRGSRQEEPE